MFAFLLIGAVLGGAFALVLGGVLAVGLGVGLASLGALAGVTSWLSGFLVVALGAVGAAGSVAFVILVWFIVVAIFYAIGAVTVAGATVGASPTTPAVLINPTPLDSVARGFAIGSTAVGNFVLWMLVVGSWGVLGVVALPVAMLLLVVGLLCIFPPLTRARPFQTVLGWLSWIMPLSWLATVVGLLLFLANAFSALFSGGFGVRLDVLTGNVESTGGGLALWLASLTGATGGGWNLGNFSFLAGAVGSGIRTPFNAPGLSAHESGHTLCVAAFGGFFHYVDAIDENVPPLQRLEEAYGEIMPESNRPESGYYYLPVWSP